MALYAGVVAPTSYRRVNCIQSGPCNGKMAGGGGEEEGRKYEGRKVAGSLTPMHYLSPLYDKHFHVNSGPRGHYLHITW